MLIFNRNLEIFICVVEAGGVTNAAKLLYVSQPAVSAALSKLENQLDTRLMDRDGKHGIKLTEVGHKIYALAKQAESVGVQMEQAAANARGLVTGTLRVASLASLTSTVVSPALSSFCRKHPGVAIDLREGTPREVATMVERHEVDLAVSCSPFTGFDAEALLHDRLVAALPAHTICERLNIENFEGHIIVNRPAYDTILDHVPQGAHIDTRRIVLVQNAETAIAMVHDGVGIAVLSKYTIASLTQGMQTCPFFPAVEFDIGIYALDLNRLPPAASVFACEIRQILH